MGDIHVGSGVVVPDDAIAFQAVRSSGPGGQNVNKVASKVQLRVDVDRISGLSAAARERLEALAGRRWVEGPALLITAAESRNQPDNREIAERKLVALLQQALKTPVARRQTRPTKASKERRLGEKRGRSRLKQRRGQAPMED